MLVFKSLHGLAPAYLLNEFSHLRDFHSYNTRHRDLLRLLLEQLRESGLLLESVFLDTIVRDKINVKPLILGWWGGGSYEQ